MVSSYLPYIAVWLTGLVITALLCPLVYRLATRMGVIDLPDARKVHSDPIPRWGGVAIALSFYFTTGFALWWSLGESVSPVARFVGGVTGALSGAGDQLPSDLAARSTLFGLLCGGALMVLLGMVDDVLALPAKAKLAGQIVIACVFVYFGIQISFFSHLQHGIVYLPEWAARVITVIWIIGLTNAVNLLDGLDGLLSGVSGISAAFLCVVSLMKGQVLVALLLAALSGSAFGFLRYNFNPARMFMGDTGSLFLGSMFACLSIMGALKISATLALLVPVFIMGLPIADTAWAIIRRAANGRPIFQADKEHLHHRLLSLGLSQRQAVAVIWMVNGMLGLLGVILAYTVR
ncbi:MAG: undecaprenyl/decaprenyl-phosphate alpha-N-acetylglucosaminyl 1-phosphate transferase [Proteobacteria bacterium]|nr:undecaprenyl/decaprenyl-phosphate alpha-N-acetylglucosaminyl 1-phosphate transferase [Pseudomonadota bacterium]